MSVITIAKQKAARGNVKEAFKNEAGAIDLASIMVGIIVIGLIGGVIAATVFAVIPWAQDNAAKQQLDSIASAQSAYVGLSTDGTQMQFGGAPITSTTTGGNTTYTLTTPSSGNTRKIIAAGTNKLFDGTATKVAIGSTGVGTDSHYAAAAKSASGKVFYITDTKTQATDNSVTAATTWVKTVTDAAAAL